MKQLSNKQNGFTLIELVITMIIIGLLAVAAAPRLFDLTADARAAALEGISGSISSVNNMVAAESLAAGIKTGTITTDEGLPIIIADRKVIADDICYAIGISSATGGSISTDGKYSCQLDGDTMSIADSRNPRTDCSILYTAGVTTLNVSKCDL